MSTLSVYTGSGASSSSKFGDFLDIVRLRENPLYKCTIAGGSGGQKGFSVSTSISGIYNPDRPFSVSVKSDYVDSFEFPLSDKVNQVTNFGANMSGNTQFILKSLRMTEQRWNGSTAPEFNITLDIPIINKTDASWSVVKYILQATSGTLIDYKKGNNQVVSTDSATQIFAPNGYRITYSSAKGSSDKPEGTYTISLGEGASHCWFRMPNAVITNMDCQIGSKKYKDGNPTSISVSVGFKFWRQPLFEDVITWFPLMK